MKLTRYAIAFIHVPLALLAVVLGFASDMLLEYLEWVDRRFIK